MNSNTAKVQDGVTNPDNITTPRARATDDLASDNQQGNHDNYSNASYLQLLHNTNIGKLPLGEDAENTHKNNEGSPVSNSTTMPDSERLEGMKYIDVNN